MSKLSIPGINAQRIHSMLTGDRPNPMQPIRQYGIVQIGNQRVHVTRWTSEMIAERDANRAREYARNRKHTCAISEAGEYCGHVS